MMTARARAVHHRQRTARQEMTRKVKPAAVKIVPQALGNVQGKFKLRCFGKILTQATVVSNRLVKDRTYHWHKLAFEIAE